MSTPCQLPLPLQLFLKPVHHPEPRKPIPFFAMRLQDERMAMIG